MGSRVSESRKIRTNLLQTLDVLEFGLEKPYLSTSIHCPQGEREKSVADAQGREVVSESAPVE